MVYYSCIIGVGGFGIAHLDKLGQYQSHEASMSNKITDSYVFYFVKNFRYRGACRVNEVCIDSTNEGLLVCARNNLC